MIRSSQWTLHIDFVGELWDLERESTISGSNAGEPLVNARRPMIRRQNTPSDGSVLSWAHGRLRGTSRAPDASFPILIPCGLCPAQPMEDEERY